MLNMTFSGGAREGYAIVGHVALTFRADLDSAMASKFSHPSGMDGIAGVNKQLGSYSEWRRPYAGMRLEQASSAGNVSVDCKKGCS